MMAVQFEDLPDGFEPFDKPKKPRNVDSLSPEHFVQRYAPIAQQIEQQTGLPALYSLTQAAHETGWGRKAPGNNFFGIKGPGQKFATHEVLNGRSVGLTDSFRAYDNPGDSFRDYARLMQKPRYRGALSAQSPQEFFHRIAQSGYATDPHYATKLSKVAAKIGPLLGIGTAQARLLTPDVQFEDLPDGFDPFGDAPTATATPSRAVQLEDLPDGFDPFDGQPQDTTQTQPDSTALGSAARAAGMSLVPAAGGLAGGLAGAKAGALAVGALTGAMTGGTMAPVGAAVGGIAGGLLGGLGGGALLNRAQEYALDTFLPEGQKAALDQQLAVDRAQHPYATLAGEVAPMALAMKPSVRNIAEAGQTVQSLLSGAGRQALRTDPQAAARIANAANVALGTGTGAALEGAQQLDRGEFDPGRLALATGAGALLSEPNRLGRALGFTPARPQVPDELIRANRSAAPEGVPDVAPEVATQAPQEQPPAFADIIATPDGDVIRPDLQRVFGDDAPPPRAPDDVIQPPRKNDTDADINSMARAPSRETQSPDAIIPADAAPLPSDGELQPGARAGTGADAQEPLATQADAVPSGGLDPANPPRNPESLARGAEQDGMAGETPTPKPADVRELIQQADELERLGQSTENARVRQALFSDALSLRREADAVREGQKPKLTTQERQRRARIVQPDQDDLVTAIRKLGGIDVNLESDWAGRLSHLPRKGFGLPAIEQTKPGRGRSLDDLAESLHDLGYLRARDVDELYGKLDDAAAGTEVYGLMRQDFETPPPARERGRMSSDNDWRFNQDRYDFTPDDGVDFVIDTDSGTVVPARPLGVDDLRTLEADYNDYQQSQGIVTREERDWFARESAGLNDPAAGAGPAEQPGGRGDAGRLGAQDGLDGAPAGRPRAGQAELPGLEPRNETRQALFDRERALAERRSGEAIPAGIDGGLFDEGRTRQIDMADVLNANPGQPGAELYSSGDGAVGRRQSGPAGGEMVRPDQIIHELSQALDVPIRRGRFTRQALGIFKTKAEVIRRHGYNDLETVAHEIGHLLDTRFAEIAPMAQRYQAELLPIASKPKKGTPVLGEGLAEYVRLHLSQPQEARAKAPGFDAEFNQFLARQPKLNDIMTRARGQIDHWFKLSPEDQIRTYMGERPQSLGEKLEGSTQKAVTQLLDALNPIKLAARELAQGAKLPASRDPYLLARVAAGSDGIVDHFLRKGTLAFDFDARAQGAKGKPLLEVLKPVASRLDDFEIYAAMRRADELRGQGRERLFSDYQIDGALKNLDSPEFRQAFDDLQTFQQEVLQFAKDGGMLDDKTYQAVLDANKNYVPFFRIMQEGGARAGRGFVNQTDVVKRLRGSSLNVQHPLQSIIENTTLMVTATNRNLVARRMAELAEATQGGGKWMERLPLKTSSVQVRTDEIAQKFKQAGVALDDATLDLLGDTQTFFRMKAESDARNHEIVVRMANGERAVFHVEQNLFEAMTRMSPGEAGMVVQLLSLPARTVRAGVVLNPEYMLRNLMRDTLSAWIQSKSGFKPGYDTARGMLSRLRQDDDYWRFMAFGGSGSTFWGIDTPKSRRALMDLVKRKGGSQSLLDHVLDTPGKLSRVLNTLGEATELPSRLGEFKRLYDKGGRTGDAALEGTYGAREVSTDFAMRGANPSLYFLSRVTPFLNAGIQGLYKAGRTLGEDGFKRSFLPVTAKLLASITLPTVALHLYNRAQEWYDDIPEWERNLFWHIRLPGAMHEQVFNTKDPFRILKPFEYGFLGGTLPEYVTDAVLDEEIKKSGRGAALAAYDIFGLRMIPPMMLIPLEEWANKSQFTGRAIVPEGKTKLDPFQQYNAFTSESAKSIGKAFNMSPARIEHVARGLFANIGMTALMLGDQALRMTGDYPEPVDTPWSQKPVAKVFFSRTPNSASRQMEEFYRTLDDVRRKMNTLRELNKEGPDDALADYERQPDTQRAIDLQGTFESASKQIRAINKDMEDIRQDRKMSGAQKRSKLDELIREMNDVAREANRDAESLTEAR